MENLYIEPTKVTPYINFDAQSGILEMRGRSSPEDALLFYGQLIAKLDEYAANGHESLTANVIFEYFNTSSTKCLFDVFRRIKKVELMGKDIEVNWHYEDGDDDMMEAGEDFADLLDIEFNFVMIEE